VLGGRLIDSNSGLAGHVGFAYSSRSWWRRGRDEVGGLVIIGWC
jgi:hypothetical protein